MAWMADNTSQENREACLEQWATRLRHIEQKASLFFHPREDYSDEQRLRPGIEAKTGFQWNSPAGQTRDAAAGAHTDNLKK
jgi:NAD(P)H dehydrogenase (quinone)